jgi:hypothetical protein
MRHSKKLLGLTAVLLFAACDNGITDPFQRASGTYELTVYAGRQVPATYTIQPGDPSYPQYPNGATFVVTDGELVLNSNGTFIETNNYVTTPTGGVGENSSFVSSGTWQVNGTSLFLTAPPQNGIGQRNVQGTLDGDSVSYQESDGVGGFDSYEYVR